MRTTGSLTHAILPLAATAALTLTVIGGSEQRAMAGDIAAAEVLFNDGQKLFDAGKIHEACEKFQESYTQDPAVGTMINLARCHEKEGKTATAWGEYKAVEVQASRSNQPQRQQYAHDEAAKLEPTLHQLVLNVKFPVEGLEITRNGTGVGKALWGEKIPVDPGDVVLKATAPGKKPWNQTVHLAAGPGIDHFDIPALVDAPVEAPKGKDTVVITPAGWPTQKYVGVGLAGAGVVAVGVAIGVHVLGLSEDSKSSSFNAAATTEQGIKPTCKVPAGSQPDKNNCPQSYQVYSHHEAYKTDVNFIAIPLYIAGGALIVGGAVLFFTAKPAEPTKVEKTSLNVLPVWTPTQSGLSVTGTF